ncbi:MAG: membrane protein insertase YidC [Actinobacteria bacterium]|nr:membrane protein insertase YidC [Actinomycetota bacterium]MSZ49702.1 membrane protein insertase YidC [Actinomycetota bacterium]MTA97591.1 membrane protein insertase YidC [Actinomycetota bacterium]
MNTVLGPLEWIVSFVLVAFHSGLTALGLPADGGASWTLSIVGLVILIRIILIPLFVRQIKAQRGLQILQPKMKEIQKKYKDDREKQSQEMMKLYKETGTNPLASCLPILAQSPIFFALFRVLNGIATGQALGVLTPELLESARNARVFGAPLYATFANANEYAAQGVSATSVRIVTVILIALMTFTTFTTQRQLMLKNMPTDNPMAQQQKILLYVFPLMFAFFGINFPIGVLIYWLTTNLWTMGQQFYVIRNNPTPGTPAEAAYNERQAIKAARGGSLIQRVTGRGPVVSNEPVEKIEEPKVVRQQPKRKPKSARKKQ